MASVQIDAHSDSDLLNLSRAGDRAAFGVLWQRHRLAGIVAARNIASTLDPDDLVSSAYLKIFELVEDGRGPTGAFRPYLYRVISSLAADTYRSSEYSNIDLAEVPDLTEAGPWETDAFDLNAAARAFASLPDRWQAALWYTEVEGLAPREIAPLLGLSANGVSALAARAKVGLQSAWVDTHINMLLADDTCRSVRERLQRFQLGKLTSRRSREVSAHLDTCDSCTAAAAELALLHKQLALVLVTILIGGSGAVALLQQFGAATVAGASGSAAVIGKSASQASQTAGSGSAASSGSVAGAGMGAGAGASIGGFSVTALLVTSALSVTALAGAGILVTSILAPGVDTTSSADAEQGTLETTAVDGTRREKLSQQLGATAENVADPDTEENASSIRATRSNARGTPLNAPNTDSIGNRAETGASGTGKSGEVAPPPPPPPLVDPNLDTSLSIGSICRADQSGLGDFQLTADANEYGLIQARIPRTNGTDIYLVPTQFDPANPASLFVNREFTDPHGNTFTEGFLTGTDVTQGNFWLSDPITPLSQWDSSLDDNEFGSISIELRLLKPNGHYSPWTVAYSPLVQPPSCWQEDAAPL